MADGPKDKYGRTLDRYGRVVRGAGAQGAEEESQINKPGALGAAAAAARAKASPSPTPTDMGGSTAVPASTGGLSEAQKRMAAEEAAEEEARRKRRKAPIKPRM